MGYSVIKRNEVLIHAISWMNLENMMLCERSQTRKVTILHDSIFIKMSNTGKSIETESILIVSRGWGRAELGVTANRCGVSLG